jgi:ribonuclease BN (tRNA processing enzyme)
LTVTVLGSAGTFPHPDNPCSGYLVRTPHATVWVDTGPGTFAALQEHLPLAEVDAIVVSHEHPDHWVELPVVRNAARYALGIDHLPVYGTEGTRRLLGAVAGDDISPIEWTTVTDGSEALVGDLQVRFARTDHSVETLAMRFEAGGRVLAYSADTGAGWSFTSLDPRGDGFDLALCEATLERHEAGTAPHLSAAEAGAMADAAGVRRLALVHFYEGRGADHADEASEREAFDGPVEIGRPGLTFTV